MKKHLLAVAITTAFLPSIGQTDTFLGIYAGAGVWQQEYTGDIETFGTTVNVEQALGLDDETGTVLWAALEHPIPFLPNIRISSIELSTTGEGIIQQSFTFDNQVYDVGVTTLTQLDLDHNEITLYYEILDNWVNLDLGITVKIFDGALEIQGGGENGNVDLDEPIPMLYGRAAFELPLTGLRLDVEGSVISFDDNSLYDVSAEIAYETFIGLGAELGYRAIEADVSEFSDDLTVDTSFRGPYFNVYYHF
ncbi:MAG: TIGR04219 family outer membrane beta-barrel protein [Pseudomonadota bacterium]